MTDELERGEDDDYMIGDINNMIDYNGHRLIESVYLLYTQGQSFPRQYPNPNLFESSERCE